MTPDLQHALVTLLGALALGVPLTARAIPKAIEKWSAAKAEAAKTEAEAKRTLSDTGKIRAETDAAVLADLRRRLDECERKHEAADAHIEHLQRQSASDAELLAKLYDKAERDEAVARGMRIELDDLRRVVQQGGRHG